MMFWSLPARPHRPARGIWLRLGLPSSPGRKALAVATVSGLLSAVALPLKAQSTRHYELDLASPVVKQTVDPGSLSITLVNRIPKERYEVTIERRAFAIAALVLPTSGAQGLAGTTCSDSRGELVDRLDTVSTEARVAAIVRNARSDEAWAECSSTLGPVIEEYTTQSLREQTLRSGEELVVTVTRPAAKATATWEFVLTTGARGEWRTLYGVTFLPDRGRNYFADPVAGASGKYVITQEHDQGGLKYLPSVLFAWMPASQRYGNFAYGLTAGLGADFTDLALLTGLAATYNENVTFTGGVAVHHVARLNGRYEEGDEITENLTPEQLRTNRFLPNVYIGVAFRFGSSPFDVLGKKKEEAGSHPNLNDPDNAAKKSTPTAGTGGNHGSDAASGTTTPAAGGAGSGHPANGAHPTSTSGGTPPAAPVP